MPRKQAATRIDAVASSAPPPAQTVACASESTKFFTMRSPLSVMIDSGWNCTPCTRGKARWRTPMIVPSSHLRRARAGGGPGWGVVAGLGKGGRAAEADLGDGGGSSRGVQGSSVGSGSGERHCCCLTPPHTPAAPAAPAATPRPHPTSTSCHDQTSCPAGTHQAVTSSSSGQLSFAMTRLW